MENETNGPRVYAAICAVTGDLAKEGISKDRQNQQQGYKFRGIDDVYNALASLLAKHKLCILPRVVSREQVERQAKTGGTLFYTVVHVEYDFVSGEDGSKHPCSTYGEAMDSADKSTNKAMSAAYKYLAMQAFCIPTEGEDADATTHAVAGRSQPQAQRQQAPKPQPVAVEPKTESATQHVKPATTGTFDIVKEFGELKKRLQKAAGALGEVKYYDILLKYKREKSSEFDPHKPGDVTEARSCYKEMLGEVKRLEFEKNQAEHAKSLANQEIDAAEPPPEAA